MRADFVLRMSSRDVSPYGAQNELASYGESPASASVHFRDWCRSGIATTRLLRAANERCLCQTSLTWAREASVRAGSVDFTRAEYRDCACQRAAHFPYVSLIPLISPNNLRP